MEIAKITNKRSCKKSLSEELLDYLYDNFGSIFESAIKSLKYKSIVEDDPNFTDTPKKYLFVGVGCGITYPVFRKNNKKLQEIAKAATKYRSTKILQLFLKMFSKSDQKHYKDIGCPLEAIWSQDRGIQLSYWYAVRKFAQLKGLKLEIRSMFD